MDCTNNKRVLIICNSKRHPIWKKLFRDIEGYLAAFVTPQEILAADTEPRQKLSANILVCDLTASASAPGFLPELNRFLGAFPGPRLLSENTATAHWAGEIQATDGIFTTGAVAAVAESQLNSLVRAHRLRNQHHRLRRQVPLGHQAQSLIAAFIQPHLEAEAGRKAPAAASSPNQASVVWLGLADVCRWQQKLPPGAFSDLCQAWFARLQQSLRKFNVLRLSATTAVVLAATGHDSTRHWFSRLREAFQKKPFAVQGQSLLTDLVGVAFTDFCRHGDASEWITEAETQLGQLQSGTQKNPAGGLYFVAESAGDKAYHLIKAQLQQAIAERRITWLYQPFVGKHEDGREKYQLMMRVVTSTGKELAGKDYIDVARRSGLLEELDAMVLEQAIRWLHQTPAEQQFCLLVNQDLHAYLTTPGLKQRLQLIDTEMHPDSDAPFAHQLVIQFDTDQAVVQMARLADIGEALHQDGITLCLSGFRDDDSHWQAAKALQADWVRSDPPGHNEKLFSGGEKSPFASLVERAHNSHIKVLVPQVDTMDMMARLWNQDVDFLQGYFIQRPAADVAFTFQQQTL